MRSLAEFGAGRELLIDGGYRPSADGRTFEDTSPVTGETIGAVAAATDADAIAAIDAAAAAFTDWSRTSYLDRRGYLLRAADLLESSSELIFDLLAVETGAVRDWAEMNVVEAAATLREAAGLTSSPLGTLYRSYDPHTVNLSLREPAGVVLAIIPWNAPLILSARAAAIAIALGNTVVFRPSEEAPAAAAHVLARALMQAGVPSGVVNVVTTAPGDSPAIITAMIEHSAVRRVVFIGSTEVGRKIASVAGRALTPAVMELGGKNATIIRADADLDFWIPKVAFAAFANAGQVCMCSERVIVDHRIAEDVAHRLADFANRIVVGDPRLPETELGPVINARAAANFISIVDDAVAAGARIRAGGERDGLYARPTVLSDVPVQSRFYLEESFLPIVSVSAAESDDDAIRLANEGGYGLIGSVISADGARAELLAHRLAAGAVHVNGPSVGDEPHVPFGGIGASGVGRLGGEESVRFFTEQRSVYRHESWSSA